MISRWYKWTFKTLLVVLTANFSFSQIPPPPAWRCVSTLGNDIEVNWEPVSDPTNQFVQYELYSLEDGLLTVLSNLNSTSFLHTGITGLRSYYVRVVFSTGSSDGSVQKNIQISLSNPSNGTAVLTWNNPPLNISKPFSTKVYIEREYPAGTWTLLDSVSFGVNNYRDTIDICSAYLSYRLKYPGNTCVSNSNIVGDDFEDKTTPDVPILTSISVDTLTNEVQLKWNQNEQKDTYGYVVYKRNAAGFLVEIDTVWGFTNTSYSYVENTTLGPLTYSIAAFDSCFTQTAPPTYQTSAKANLHTSIFLQGTYNPCFGSVTLSWSDYLGDLPIKGYEVFATDSQNNWQSRGITNSTTFAVQFNTSGLYYFVVEGELISGTKLFSNEISIQVNTTGPPTINYIVSASVVDASVELHHLVDPNSNVKWIAFDRMGNNGVFSEIARIQISGPQTIYLDNEARIDKVNSYRAVVVDSCGNRTVMSDTVSTIFGQVESNEKEYSIQFTFTPYLGYDGGVDYYEIYRGIDGDYGSNPVAVVTASESTYFEYLDTLYAPRRLCYKVIAVENPNQYGLVGRSGSNDACAKFDPTLYVPSAFIPTGINSKFRPVYSYQSYPYYELLVYNRWAQLVHQSDQSSDGWDGNILESSEPAGLGVYIYRLRFYNDEGAEIIKEGSLTLIR